MKRILVLQVLLFIGWYAWSQNNQPTQDTAAGAVLDRVALKFNSMKSLQSNFELVISDRKEKTKNASSGNLMLKQKKYKLVSEGNMVYFDGTTMWTYVSATNEVTITEPDNQGGDFMSNPAGFFSYYKRDFKYRYVKETTINGVRCHEIDLFPKNLNQPYSRIKIYVNMQSDLPVTIGSIGKDGIDYMVNLKDLVLDRDLADTSFTFDPAKFKKVEVIDMRGLE